MRPLAMMTGLLLVLTQLPAAAAPREYDVPVELLGLDGKPSVENPVSFVQRATGESWTAMTGTTVRLPRGEYLVHAALDQDDAYHLVQPSLRVEGATRVRLDFREAKPVKLSIDRPGLRERGTMFGLALLKGDGPYRTVISDRVEAPRRLYLGTVGAGTDPGRLVSTVTQQWVATEDGTDAPAEVVTHDIRRGAFFSGLARQVRSAELATVVSVHHAERASSKALVQVDPTFPGSPQGFVPFSLNYSRVPKKLTRLLEAGEVSWTARFVEWEPGDEKAHLVAELRQPATRYEAGRTAREEWNKGGFGPWIGSKADPAVGRIGAGLSIAVPMFGDGQGRRGSATAEKSSVRLLRDGKVLGSASDGDPGVLDIPTMRPGAATYRLEATARRIRHSVATEVSATWTFRWDWAEGLTVDPRLWTARFHPVLDPNNRLTRRAVVKLPLTLDQQRDSGSARLATPRVWSSTDGGRTWQVAKVKGAAEAYTVEIRPGATARTLSLRVAASDDQGSSLDQTVKSAFIFG